MTIKRVPRRVVAFEPFHDCIVAAADDGTMWEIAPQYPDAKWTQLPELPPAEINDPYAPPPPEENPH